MSKKYEHSLNICVWLGFGGCGVVYRVCNTGSCGSCQGHILPILLAAE
jgi:hypothetical protein